MNLTPNPFDVEQYPERGVLYVRIDGGLVRFNVAVGIQMLDKDTRDIVFVGTNLGTHKIIHTAQTED